MSRPRVRRQIQANPEIIFFKPQGVPIRALEITSLELEEFETLRLKYQEGLDQKQAAKKMSTSQSTYQRILSTAQKKVAEAILSGKAIRIQTQS